MKDRKIIINSLKRYVYLHVYFCTPKYQKQNNHKSIVIWLRFNPVV